MTAHQAENSHSLLHIVFSDTGWQKAQAFISSHDSVLLGGSALAWSSAVPNTCKLYVLDVDCRQVGIEPPSTARVISDEEWVELVLHNANRVAW